MSFPMGLNAAMPIPTSETRCHRWRPKYGELHPVPQKNTHRVIALFARARSHDEFDRPIVQPQQAEHPCFLVSEAERTQLPAFVMHKENFADTGRKAVKQQAHCDFAVRRD